MIRVLALGLVALAGTAYSTSTVQAQVLFQHSGSTSPISEGWSQRGPNAAGVSAGPVTNDLGLGIHAWNVTDASEVDGSYLQYEVTPSPGQVAGAALTGWRLTASLRVTTTPDPVDASVYAQYIANNRNFLLTVGSNANGDPEVLLATGHIGNTLLGNILTLSGLGAGYHTYELSLAGGSSAAILEVDGQVVATGYEGFESNSDALVGWGTGQSSTTGAANFSLIQFAATPVPEPAGCLALGTLLVLGVNSLRRRCSLPAPASRS